MLRLTQQEVKEPLEDKQKCANTVSTKILSIKTFCTSSENSAFSTKDILQLRQYMSIRINSLLINYLA
jgi:hypothetical protein